MVGQRAAGLDGWTIGAHRPAEEGQTGGFFSEGNLCTSASGQRAFLKVIDLFGVLKETNFLAALNALTDGVMCEQELLKSCKRMDRVVSALAFGNVRHVVRASVRHIDSRVSAFTGRFVRGFIAVD